ncbi:MAG: sensor histidine kinase, partial [Dehalococcoidia bacterium]
VFDATGTGTLVVSVFHDVTAAREFDRARDEFLASVSHDLKTPLTAIQGFAQLVARRAGRAPQSQSVWLREPIEGIEKAAARMSGLIFEFLDVARMQMGQALYLDKRHTDLVGLAAREIGIRQRTTERHRIVLDARVARLVGDWDTTRLERALGNLIGNAIKYSTMGGEITVIVDRGEDPAAPEALLSVCDNGIGIPLEELRRVFDRFYRATNVVGSGIEGAGIGLSSVRQIVAQHGGSVELHSVEREGTTVTLHLPLGGDES